MKNVGVISMGIKAPIIREGDDLSKIVVNAVLDTTFIETKYENVEDLGTKSGTKTEKNNIYDINDGDIIGITESVVARSVGNYVTIDEIANELKNKFREADNYTLVNPIYSRNRFSMILKAIARAAKESVIIYMPDADEVGNPSGVNQFTGVNMKDYYIELVEGEGKKCVIHEGEWMNIFNRMSKDVTIYCGLHDYNQWKSDYGDNIHITLADICSDKCEYGLLGSNKANEEKLKLFPSKKSAQTLVENIQKEMLKKTNKTVQVMIYGDGCFKDPVGGIWEFADPEVSPAYTSGLAGRPNEIKIKAFADGKYANLSGTELELAIKAEIKSKSNNLVGNMDSQGTTPRRYIDLLGSLMDLTSGSGDRGTPIILVENYFKNYSN